MQNKDSSVAEKNLYVSKEASRQSIIELVRREMNVAAREFDDIEVMEIIEKHIFQEKNYSSEHPKDKVKLAENVFYSLRKDLGILEPFASDSQISEIMVNGRDHIFVERRGMLQRTDLHFHNTEELEEVIRRLGARVHREINEMNPILDARLEDGSRINAVYKNIVIDGPALTIRKFPERPIDMEQLICLGTITQEGADFLEELVKAGYNMLISGGTSSGKTTFLNVLTEYIPKEERIIVIEDSAELRLEKADNIIRMECRNANVQGKGQVDMRQLIRTSLRMRPDRIIVGEVRGGEVMDMIQAMNTGHDGSLSTGHGNSTLGMLFRLEAMFLQAVNYPVEAIRAQISEGIDIMIHLGRNRDNQRVVLEISEIVGMQGNHILLNILFKYKINEGLQRTDAPLKNREKLQYRGGT